MGNRNIAFVMIILIVLITGCGDNSQSVSETPLATGIPSDDSLPDAEPQSGEPYHVVVTDGLGREVSLTTLPVQLVSLTLATDEILFDLVETERLAAITSDAQNPMISVIAEHPALADIPTLIDYNPETVLAFEPDLVFVDMNTPEDVLMTLDLAGIPYYTFPHMISIDAVREQVLIIGKLVNKEEVAAGLIAEMDASLGRIRDVVANVAMPLTPVLYLNADGYAPGASTLAHDIISTGGGLNVTAQQDGWIRLESALTTELSPDMVILSPALPDDVFRFNPAYEHLPALQQDNIHFMPDAYMIPSQYVILGVETVAKLMFPTVFSDS